jgi:hypothetical protein
VQEQINEEMMGQLEMAKNMDDDTIQTLLDSVNSNGEQA